MLSRVTRSAAVVLLVSLGVSACSALEDEPTSSTRAPVIIKDGSLTVCTDIPYEPFEFEKDGKSIGFDIDLVDEVAKRLKLQPAVVDTGFDEIASGESLNEGQCDVAISAMTITGDRARVLDFSSPYFNASQAMVVVKGSGLSSLAALSGRKIGVQSGTTGELYVTDNAPADAQIVPVEDSAAMDAAIKNGQVDAAVYDNTVVGGVIANNPNLQVAAEFDTGEQYGMAVKKDGNVDLLRTINDVLADLKHNGGYDTIYAKWFGSTPSA
jgi:polar amino acid transport system substrate-binding protein